MSRTAAVSLGTTTLLCLFAIASGCSGGSGGDGVLAADVCNDGGNCNGTYQGTVSGEAVSSGCVNRTVKFKLTDNVIEFSEFKADCALAPCSRCQGSFDRSSTLDPDACTFSLSRTGIYGIGGELAPSTCEFTGTYFYGGDPGCPCYTTGSWNAAR